MKANLDGANKKFKSLEQFSRAVSFLPRDAAAWAAFKLSSEILNLPQDAVHPTDENKGYGVIRRITGMLVRSITLAKGQTENSIRLFMNTAIAPYAEKVNEWSKNRYGHGYVELFLSFYKEDILRIIAKELNDAIRKINSDQGYKYRNPFPI